jgi:hypothetical protein
MQDQMTPRERWLAVLGREPFDRVPLDYRATAEVTKQLTAYMDAENWTEVRERLHIDPAKTGESLTEQPVQLPGIATCHPVRILLEEGGGYLVDIDTLTRSFRTRSTPAQTLGTHRPAVQNQVLLRRFSAELFGDDLEAARFAGEIEDFKLKLRRAEEVYLNDVQPATGTGKTDIQPFAGRAVLADIGGMVLVDYISQVYSCCLRVFRE